MNKLDTISTMSQEKIEKKNLHFYLLDQPKAHQLFFLLFSPSSLKAIILQLIFMAQREIMGILSNVEMYVFLLVNQNRPYFKLVS